MEVESGSHRGQTILLSAHSTSTLLPEAPIIPPATTSMALSLPNYQLGVGKLVPRYGVGGQYRNIAMWLIKTALH